MEIRLPAHDSKLSILKQNVDAFLKDTELYAKPGTGQDVHFEALYMDGKVEITLDLYPPICHG